MSDFGKELIEAMEEAVAHAEGRPSGVTLREVCKVEDEIRKARKTLGATQPDFASLLGTSVSGLQKWEQGQRKPPGAVMTLVRLIEVAPEAMRTAIEQNRERLSA